MNSSQGKNFNHANYWLLPFQMRSGEPVADQLVHPTSAPAAQFLEWLHVLQIAVTEAAIARGKEIVRLQKRLEKVSKMLG